MTLNSEDWDSDAGKHFLETVDRICNGGPGLEDLEIKQIRDERC
jgi:hypothetical protein